MKGVDLLLPEWVFLEASSHLGNLLDGRDVLQHIPSYTIMEVFALNEISLKIDPKVQTKEFTYENSLGEIERYIIVVHLSLLDKSNLVDDVIQAGIEFYKKYIAWEDRNIEDSEISKLN